MRKDKLLTQVVHSIAYSYTLVDFGEKKRKWTKLQIKYILLVDQIQLDGSENSHIIFLIYRYSKHKQKAIITITTLATTFTAPRTKYEWRQNYSLKVKNGYFPS